MKKLDGYAGNVSFWNKKQPKVIGDLLGRKQVLDMLKNIKNKKILDSACGSGYMARRLAKEEKLFDDLVGKSIYTFIEGRK